MALKFNKDWKRTIKEMEKIQADCKRRIAEIKRING